MHLRRGSLAFVLLLGGCDDGDRECQQEPTTYSFDEPGPWGETPEQVFGHTQGLVSGTVMWVGPYEEEGLDPALAQTSAELELTLDTTASGAAYRLLGPCNGTLEVDATLSIVTADGALDESIPIVLKASPDSTAVTTFVDLTGYDFAGTLELSSGWTKHEMMLFLRWARNGDIMGFMRTGEPLEAEAAVDPDVKSGLYAMFL